ATTSALLSRPLQHHGFLWYADFSPDGRYVVTASGDKTARVWDSATGEPITPPLRHPGGVSIAAVSPDGRRVATAGEGEGSMLRLWQLPQDHRPAPDLMLLTQLLSSRRVDARAGATPLKPTVLQSAWQILRARYPADFTMPREKAVVWHQRQAEE